MVNGQGQNLNQYQNTRNHRTCIEKHTNKPTSQPAKQSSIQPTNNIQTYKQTNKIVYFFCV